MVRLESKWCYEVWFMHRAVMPVRFVTVHDCKQQQGWLLGWLVSGAPTFAIWHHSLIQSRDLTPLINSVLVLVTSAKVIKHSMVLLTK